MIVRRYSMAATTKPSDAVTVAMVPDHAGAWVRYQDYEEGVRRLQERAEQVQSMQERLEELMVTRDG